MSSKDKFAAMANNIVGLVGGKDNITWFTHCVTRLRFTVKDRGLVQKEEIDKLGGSLGSQWSGDQFQVIIGPDVDDAYRAVCEANDIAPQDAVDENLDGDMTPKQKLTWKNALTTGIATISGTIAPLIPMLCAVGMLKVVLALCGTLGIMTPESATYITIDFLSDAGLMFLPVAVGASAAKKFGADMFIGIMLGAALIHPTFQAMVADGNPGSIYGIPIAPVSYLYSIFPMILTMFVASYVEKFFNKHIHPTVRLVFAPVLTLLVVAPLMFCVLGPLGSFLGSFLANGVMFIYNRVGFLAIALLAAFDPLIIMTGMHLAFDPITLNMFATQGFDPLMGIAQIVHNVDEGAIALAVAFRSKNNPALRAEGISCGITAIIGGIPEPSIFGFTMKYKGLLPAIMIGNFCGGLYGGLMHVLRYAYGGGSVLGLAVFIDPNPWNLIHCIIAFCIGFVVTFIAACILYKPEELGAQDSEEVAGEIAGSVAA
ncbi:PTS transporter subunit EIIC [Collinsella provencensis]|uniref:PTS transporter subunit EIIC n=1 Tax=Collinsella provencensis TaxID=1937461 RepID=UPI000C8521E7|nr:PTS transporter subunit EIIC [Collinsella provencensis]